MLKSLVFTSPTMYGDPASPNAWEIRIEKASAVERLVGMTTYYAAAAK